MTSDCREHSGIEARIRVLEREVGEQWQRINDMERMINRAMGIVIIEAVGVIGTLFLFIMNRIF